MNKTAISIILTAVFISGAIFLLSDKKSTENSPSSYSTQNNVTTAEGKQVVEIQARGGYVPRVSLAKANTPTVIKVKTSGTFDCSSALTIPAISYQANLPSSGETVIEVPPQKEGSTLRGICAMGMYSFAINFN